MRVFAITLAFCNPKVLERSIRAFYASRNPDMELEHVIVDQHYPMHRKETAVLLASLAGEFGIRVLDPGKNLGLHAGFNWAMCALNPRDEDIIIGYDGDSLPISPGWDMALVRAIDGTKTQHGKKVVWSTLGNPRTIKDINLRGFDKATADGYLDIWLTRTSITNSVCAWRYGWLRSVGFLHEPRAFYGHLEAEMWGRMRKDREAWGVLPGWQESDELRDFHDREYVVYKWKHAHEKSWPGDFESFVAAGCPGMAMAPEKIP